jgi:hypothetical protein
MKSNLEKRFDGQRKSAEALISAAHGEDVLEMLCSFTELECVIDAKLDSEGWIRYLLIEGGEGENDDSLRRIG